MIPGSLKIQKKILLIALAVIGIVIVLSIFGAEYYTSQPEFCGACHIMERYYNSWEKSKHGEKDVTCVDCHYAPGEKYTLKAKFKGLGQLFAYLSTYVEAKEVRKPAKVSDLSCTTSECHPKQKLQDKKVKFTEKISYVHKTHFDKTIEGQELHCSICHQHVRAEKHFEVPKVACYLCHFKETKFNEGRAKCSLCHEIPQTSLQKQKKEEKPDEKPITHQTLEKAQVSCQSCHYELVQGKGGIKKEDCFDCHDYSPEKLKKAEDKAMMHTEHIAAQNAQCFDCHSPIMHKEIEFLDPVRETCFACHPDHHKYQKLLLFGDKGKDVMKVPGLMYDVKTNCIGCHIDVRFIKGEKVLHGSTKACVACHTEKHEGMVNEWKNKTGEELEYAKELEKAAEDAINKATGNVSKKKLERAMAMFKEGQENMHIVEYGGGVHNKKYSVMLLDAAMNNFEDLVDLLNE
jgi:nitrate/TMAO reductase-like tetraheme cytochrome c subunit